MSRALAAGAPLSPSDSGHLAESWSFKAADGLELPVWSIQGSSSGPVTVLVHGWGESRIDWLPLVEEWLADTSQLIIPDLRGHGDAGGCFTFGRKELEDLAGLIESLDSKAVRIVGSGLGANLVLGVASLVPGAVLEVIAINPWNTDTSTLLDRFSDSGFPIRPPEGFFRLSLRLAGMDCFQLGSVPEGPVIRVKLDQGEDLQGLLDCLERKDVDIINEDGSST